MQITPGEVLFERIFDDARAVHLFKKGPLMPPSIIVALEFPDTQKQCPNLDCRLRGDQFLRFLIRIKRATNHDLRKFFPDAGSEFDIAAGRVSRKLRQRDRVIEVPDRWPCFNQSPKAFARFVKKFIKKRVEVHDGLGEQSPRRVLLIFSSGEIREEKPNAFHIGFGR